MDAAAAALQHDAFVIFPFDQGKPLPVCPQPGVAGDEIILGHPEVGGDGRDFPLTYPYVARPFAAGVAALANVVHPRLQHGQVVARAAMARRMFRERVHSSFR